MDKNAEKITITYDDGSIKELKKGLVFHIEGNPSAESITVTADMVAAMSGKDLFTVVEAAVELGVKLGMFGDTEAADDE